MEVMKAIEDGFGLGCGISLSQAMNSPRFRELLTKQNTLLSRYPENTHRGIALRAGHLVMGQLLHTLPESKALAEAKKIETPKFGCGIEMRALIQFFGESLIAEAGECLPDDVLELAREWKTASTERQIAIARELFFVFRSESQGHKKGEVLTLVKARQDLLRRAAERWDREESNGEDILPRLYGRWNEKCSANCQGKAQMLIAFAQLVGAEVMTVNTLSDGNQELRHLRNELARAITRDMRKRKLSDASSDFSDSMAGHIFAETFGEQIRDFHVGVALKLRDGHWILIDPHALSWGVFSQHHYLNSTHRLLQKYGEVLPGLALIRSDDGEMADRIRARINLSYDLIERSRKMEAVIREHVSTALDFIKVVMVSEDVLYPFL